MIDGDSTLADVCFAAAAALERAGMRPVLTGGSAAALYAPSAYVSHDADFVLEGDEPLRDVEAALAPLGYRRDGRSRLFVHPESEFTIDFPKGPLAVGGDYVSTTDVLRCGDARLCILTRFDCVRDRLAHYYYWNDFTALAAAVGVAAELDERALRSLRAWTRRESDGFDEKFAEFARRVHAARMQQGAP